MADNGVMHVNDFLNKIKIALFTSEFNQFYLVANSELEGIGSLSERGQYFLQELLGWLWPENPSDQEQDRNYLLGLIDEIRH